MTFNSGHCGSITNSTAALMEADDVRVSVKEEIGERRGSLAIDPGIGSGVRDGRDGYDNTGHRQRREWHRLIGGGATSVSCVSD